MNKAIECLCFFLVFCTCCCAQNATENQVSGASAEQAVAVSEGPKFLPMEPLAASRVLELYGGDSQKLTAENGGAVADYFINCLRWTLFRGEMDLHVCGLAGRPGETADKYQAALELGQKLQNLGVLPDFSAEQINNLTGTVYFPQDGSLIHRAGRWYFSARMGELPAVCEEKNANLQRKYAGDGSCVILTRGNEFSQALPLLDWHYYPGTTELLDRREDLSVPLSDQERQRAFVGLVDENFGLVACFLRGKTFAINKLYFCFPNAVVSAGCGIVTRDVIHPVVTTVNQGVLEMPVRLKHGTGEGMAKYGAQELLGPVTVSHGGIEYIFPDSVELGLTPLNTNGDWKTVFPDMPSTPVEQGIFLLTQNHGVLPAEAKYFYIMHPIVTHAVEISRVKTNSEKIIGVYDKTSGTAMVVFFVSGTADIPEFGKLSSPVPAVFLLKKDKYLHAEFNVKDLPDEGALAW